MQSSDLGDMLFVGTNKRADLRYEKPWKNDQNVLRTYKGFSSRDLFHNRSIPKLQLRIEPGSLPYLFSYFKCKHNMGLNLWLFKMCFYFTLPCPVAYFTSTRTKGLFTSDKIDRSKRKKTGLVFLSFFFFCFCFRVGVSFLKVVWRIQMGDL